MKEEFNFISCTGKNIYAVKWINEEQNENPIPYSPHRTPDAKRIKERIKNDNGDADELIEKSVKNASQRYNAFLKSRAPLLIDNEKKMEKVRKEMENEEE